MKANFEKEYGTSSGNRFMRFIADDGRWAEVRTRVGRDGPQLFTREEVKAIATVHFLGICGGHGRCPVTTVHHP